MNYSNYISLNKDIRFGKLCIKGTRITVYDVLERLSSGMTIVQIISDYPELNAEQIKACLAYAADKEHKFTLRS